MLAASAWVIASRPASCIAAVASRRAAMTARAMRSWFLAVKLVMPAHRLVDGLGCTFDHLAHRTPPFVPTSYHMAAVRKASVATTRPPGFGPVLPGCAPARGLGNVEGYPSKPLIWAEYSRRCGGVHALCTIWRRFRLARSRFAAPLAAASQRAICAHEPFAVAA